MNRSTLVYGILLVTAGVLGAQQTNPAYQGTSNPPADDEIITTSTPQAKPSAAHRANSTFVDSTSTPRQDQPVSNDSSQNLTTPANDYGIVQAQAPRARASQPTLSERASTVDPDGDIVHPHPLGPWELGAGTTIRVKLLQSLSTTYSEKGEAFRTTVASDVLRDGQVLIPAGTEIDGRVVEVSSGHLGTHGSLRLRPETVLFSDGSRYQLHADLSGTPGSKTRMGSEGEVDPGSRVKRDSIEYGGAVGAGATTGAILGGPVGALTGSLIGAGVVTAHLLASHPQATLETGTTLLFTLTDTLSLVPTNGNGS